MRTYWWRTQPNFGDTLGPFLLARMFGISTEWVAPPFAEVITIGSVIDVLPPLWTGRIVGSGKLHWYSHIPQGATVVGLRGHLSGQGFDGPYVAGDPGLLVDECIPQQAKIHDLGVVPHWTDHDLAARFAHLDPFVIDPTSPVERIIAQIAQCKKIVASSLHGIVVADAFGIPRRAEKFAAMNRPAEGGTFKFEDYGSGIDFPAEFGILQSPPRKNIERVQADLHDMMQGEFGA